MRAIFVLVLGLCASATYAAGNGCHFKSRNAIVCTDPQNAAIAYNNFGFDAARTDVDYNRQLLQESGCGRAYGKTYATAHIREFKRGRVALPNGWVGVSFVDVDGRDAWYVATDYLEGICEAYKPTTTTLKQDYAVPDYSH
jgi:hypothetical protein